ncbi:MAG: DUF7507 domain-containing protein, partial [Erythrobacter sp.]
DEELTLEDSVDVPVECDPSFTLDKKVVDVGGEGPDGTVDEAGDVITYAIEIFNDGNVTLTLDDLTDTLEGLGIDVGTVAESGGLANGKLDPGETWTYTFTETVSQTELDAQCATDEKITNSVTATFLAPDDEELTLEDSVDVPVECDPGIDVEKSVKTDQAGYLDELNAINPDNSDDNPDGLLASTSSTVEFRVSIKNTGNVSLTNLTLSDSVTHFVNGVATSQAISYYNDGDASTLDASNVWIDLDGDGLLGAGEDWATVDGLDGAVDGVLGSVTLEVGERLNVYYSLNSQLGQHENTATVTGFIGEHSATDSDDANYYVLDEDCVGVGTPGFWGNNGFVFWDGTAGNEAKHAGQPGFAEGELLYDVYLDATDSDLSGTIEPDEYGTASKGLLIGDYNQNGITDVGEDTIFIKYDDAVKLINASARQTNGGQADGVWILGRDVVATWLNFLANNPDAGQVDCIGAASNPYSAQSYLNDAIDWLQKFTDKNNDDIFDSNLLNKGSANVKTSTSSWQNGGTDQEGDAFVSGASIHKALDDYNNTGTIWDPVLQQYVEFCCDRDNAEAMDAMQQVDDYASQLLQTELLSLYSGYNTDITQDSLMLYQEANQIA